MLTGCSSASDAVVGDPDNSLQVVSVELPGDRAVDCVGSKFHTSVVEPDCNWDRVRDGAPSSKEKEHSGLQSYTVSLDGNRELLCVGSIYGSSVIDPDCDWDSINRDR